MSSSSAKVYLSDYETTGIVVAERDGQATVCLRHPESGLTIEVKRPVAGLEIHAGEGAELLRRYLDPAEPFYAYEFKAAATALLKRLGVKPSRRLSVLVEQVEQAGAL